MVAMTCEHFGARSARQFQRSGKTVSAQTARHFQRAILWIAVFSSYKSTCYRQDNFSVDNFRHPQGYAQAAAMFGRLGW
jgi:hypothetical protein